MDDMGSFSVTVRVENAASRGPQQTLSSVLVDTGSEFTWVPGEALRALGIGPERTERFVVADGRVLMREVGFAIVHVGTWSTADDVVFAGPGHLILLGARSLEGLNLRIDPRSRRLVPAGPIITAAA